MRRAEIGLRHLVDTYLSLICGNFINAFTSRYLLAAGRSFLNAALFRVEGSSSTRFHRRRRHLGYEPDGRAPEVPALENVAAAQPTGADLDGFEVLLVIPVVRHESRAAVPAIHFQRPFRTGGCAPSIISVCVFRSDCRGSPPAQAVGRGQPFIAPLLRDPRRLGRAFGNPALGVLLPPIVALLRPFPFSGEFLKVVRRSHQTKSKCSKGRCRRPERSY